MFTLCTRQPIHKYRIFFHVSVDNATYRSSAAQVVQLVLADEDGELVQVQHVVGVRCDLVWKERAAKKPRLKR